MVENPDLYIVRKTLGDLGRRLFDPRLADLLVEKIILPIQEEELSLIRGNAPTVLQRLKESFDRFGVRKQDMKPAALSAAYATDAAVDVFQSQAIALQRIRSVVLFILFFDTDFGAAMTAHPVLEVTKPPVLTDSRPDTATIIADSSEALNRFLGIKTDISSQATTYMIMEAEKKRWETLCHETSSGQPAGFLLMEEAAKQLKGLPNALESYPPPSFCIPQFVAAGADFSMTLFRAIYPISEQFIASR